MKKCRNLNDPVSIEELFKNLERQKEITVSLRINDYQLSGKMKFNHKISDEPLIYYFEDICSFKVQNILEISFFYKDTFFTFQSQIIDIFQRAFSIKKPELVIASFARSSTRYKIRKGESALLSFVENNQTYKVIEISTTGLSFEMDANTLYVGDVLRDIRININESLAFYFDAVVKHIKQVRNSFICGLSYINLDWTSSQALFYYIFEKYYPNLKSLANFSQKDISRVYDTFRLIGRITLGNEKNEFVDEIKNIDIIKDKATIAVNLVHQNNNIITGVNSALRIYDRTFIGHQPMIMPETYLNPKANADIFLGLAEHLLNHPYFQNFITYINSDLEWHTDVFKSISLIINDKDKLSFHNQVCYDYDLEYNLCGNSSDYNTEILDNPTEFIEFFHMNFTSLESDCFAYNRKMYSLNEIKGIYHTLGYTVARRLLKTTKDSQVVAYSVAECYSQEINFSNSLDTLKIYFLEDMPNIETIIYSILNSIVNFFKIKNKKKIKIYIQLTSQMPKDTFIRGLENKCLVNRIMMSREGMLEFVRLLISSFEYYTRFYNLSEPQRSIWHIEKFFPGTSIGNVSGTLKIKGEVDYVILEKAINIFVEKNDAMRIQIIEEKGIPKQYIHNYCYFKVDFFDFSNCDINEYYNWNEKQTQKPFQIIDSPLYYFAIIKLGKDLGAFYSNTHHLISDAWTMNLLINQIVDNYQNLKLNQKISAVKKPSYIDFLLDQDEFRYSDRFIKCKDFWNKKYNEFFQPVYLKPLLKVNHSTKANRKSVLLGSTLTEDVYQYCNRQKVSVFSLFMAVFSIYINRSTSADDVVIGTPILNRSGAREKETIGVFVSTIPVRLRVEVNKSFESYVHYVAKELNGCLKNQKYNYELILKDYREKHKVSDKLYDCMLSYQNSKYEKGNDPSVFEARWHSNKNQIESLIIHLDDREGSGELLLNIDYLVDLFNDREIEQLSNTLLNMIKDVIINQCNKLSEINTVGKDEKIKLENSISKFNDTKADYPKEMTIHQLFEEQVKKSPERTALLFNDKSMTYLELNEKSNQLARLLRDRGVKPNTIVGIMVYRSFEMIVGILAILKAGGAYLPIDPDYPLERKNYMLENGNVRMILTQQNINGELNDSLQKIMLDNLGIYEGDPSNLNKINTPNDLAYVIFTSGSTGAPKGVMIEHRSVINRLNWMQKRYPIGHSDIILQKTPYTFDVSVWELFWWSFYGAKLAILCPGGEKEPDKIINAINTYKITTMHFVPSMLSIFLDFIEKEINIDKVKSLRQVFASGEALTLKHSKRFFNALGNLNIALTNLYGPTEATVDVSYFDCKKDDNLKAIPIGKPIDNIRLYILNDKLQIQPIGVAGELFIAGDGLARGYLNEPNITSEKFIEVNFLGEERIYKTGDLARWLPNGDIEYLGRIDSQVKIRGLRIELGEIEHQILRLNSIKEVAVIVIDDETRNKYLCAYYVTDDRITSLELREYLSKKLPAYMIPSYFVKMEKLPLSANGKIDRKKLPDPFTCISIEDEFIEPSNEIEKRIADIWKKELKLDKVGIRDNFFNIGGDSLIAINVSSRIGEGITISDIYSYPTIEGLANEINCKKASNSIFYPVVKSEDKKETSIVCVPYGGGAPIVYNELGRELAKISDKYSVYSIILPGHDFGAISDNLKPIDEIAKLCVGEIKKSRKKDIILYGHCVGSALTIEIARLLEKEKIKIKAIFIGGIIPPKFIKYYGNILDPWRWQKEETIVKYLNKLGGVNFAFGDNELKLIMKAFRHDVRCYMKYFHDFYENKYSKISTPVYCIFGDADSSTINFSKKYKEWLNYCEKVNLISLKDANHYFVKSHAQELAKIIDQTI